MNKYIYQSNNKYYLEDHLLIQISELTAIVEIIVQCFDKTNDHFFNIIVRKKYTYTTIQMQLNIKSN